MRKLFLWCCLTGWVAIAHAGLSLHIPVKGDTDISITFDTKSEALVYEQPLEGTITFLTPVNERPRPTALVEQLRGFHNVESFEMSSLVVGAQRKTIWRYRMSLDGMGPWRLDPFVLLLENQQTKALREVLVAGVTFPTPQPLPVIEGEPVFNGDAARVPLRLVDVWEWMKDHVCWLLIALLLVAIAVSTRWWWKPLQRYLKERTLPPERRAQLEFERLMAQHLLEQGEVRRYFYELTAVIRRYFERVYHLRATRQTSEEFLHQLHALLPVDVQAWSAMQDFLKAADYVKFAGQQIPVPVAESATVDAHQIIDDDVQRRKAMEHKVAEK